MDSVSFSWFSVYGHSVHIYGGTHEQHSRRPRHRRLGRHRPRRGRAAGRRRHGRRRRTTRATRPGPRRSSPPSRRPAAGRSPSAATSPTPTQMAAAFDARRGGVRRRSTSSCNTAGIMILAPIAELDLDDLDRMHRTNIRGTVRRRPAGRPPGPRRRRDHRLLDVGDAAVASRPTAPTSPARAPSRPSTLILARELRGRDITVNAVAPGPTATPLFLDGKDRGADRPARRRRAPLERLGQPDDIAEVVAFLAGPARWVNGQTLLRQRRTRLSSDRDMSDQIIVVTGASQRASAP